MEELGQLIEPEHEDGRSFTESENTERLAEVAEDLSRGKEYTNGSTSSPQKDQAINRVTAPAGRWQDLLADFISKSGEPVGRSYRGLDRRSIQRGVIAPQVERDGLALLDIAVDVSGSIDMRRLESFVAHIEQVRKAIQIELIRIIPFESWVNQDQIVEIRRGQALPTTLQPGGGTRFSPVFNWVDQQARQPDALLIFTDMGATDFPERAPRYPVLWASSEPIESAWGKAPWGKTIEIDIVR